MALNGLFCGDVLLRNYPLTHCTTPLTPQDRRLCPHPHHKLILDEFLSHADNDSLASFMCTY